jgi:hypothetical protein
MFYTDTVQNVERPSRMPSHPTFCTPAERAPLTAAFRRTRRPQRDLAWNHRFSRRLAAVDHRQRRRGIHDDRLIQAQNAQLSAVTPRAFLRMSAICSSIQSPGSREVTISFSPAALRARSPGFIVSAA